MASILAVLLVVTAASAAPAATVKPAADPFEQVIAARGVADFARRRNSAQAMLVAARMVQEVRFVDKPGEGSLAAAGTGPAPFSADALFDEAAALAKGDDALQTQIRVARNGGRGVISSAFGAGLVRVVRDVGARAAYAFDVQAKPGELLRIGAIGDTTTKMALRLRDKRGALVCDQSGDYAPVCSFRPAAGTALRVEVLNQGDAPTKAVILSN